MLMKTFLETSGRKNLVEEDGEATGKAAESIVKQNTQIYLGH